MTQFFFCIIPEYLIMIKLQSMIHSHIMYSLKRRLKILNMTKIQSEDIFINFFVYVVQELNKLNIHKMYKIRYYVVYVTTYCGD